MSRAYRIRVSESVSRVVHVDDGLCAPVEMLPLLDKSRMALHLQKALEEQGFVVEDGKARLSLGEVEVEVDTVEGKVSLSTSHEEKVEATGVIETYGDTDFGNEKKQRADAKSAAVKAGHEQIDAQERKLQDATTKLLESKLPDVKALVDAAVNRAHLSALKEKAGSLGQVESIEESENSLSIKVRV